MNKTLDQQSPRSFSLFDYRWIHLFLWVGAITLTSTNARSQVSRPGSSLMSGAGTLPTQTQSTAAPGLGNSEENPTTGRVSSGDPSQTSFGAIAKTKPGSSGRSPFATAKIDGFVVSAEQVNRNLETGESELIGNVKILYNDQHLSADYVRINQAKKQAFLKGNVVINNPLVELGGEQIEIDYIQNTSLITKGYIKSNNVYFSGDSIRQDSLNKFYVKGANYTTCSNCPATWSFDGTEIEAEIGGYAFLKNSFLKVSGLPVLWLPYFLVPLKNERQTGLLSPEIGYIRDRQLTFSQSLFVATSRSQDLTFTFKNYEIGGLKKQIEHRYAASEKSFGEFTVSHINDSLFGSEPRYTRFVPAGEVEGRFDRWSIRGYNQHELSKGDKLRLTVNQISDLEYPHDFFDEFPNYADSGLENRLNYTSQFKGSLFSIDARYYKHLLSANALSNNSAAVHQLPEIKYDTTIKQIGDAPLFYKFSADYTHFFRERAYDDVASNGTQNYVANSNNNPGCEHGLLDADGGLIGLAGPECNPAYDGVYNPETDMIRSGQRMHLKGSLLTHAYSIGDVVNLTPEISYNESHYLFPVGDDPYSTKRFAQLELLSRSKLFRVYDRPTKRYKHEFIPEISYRWIPWSQENAHPFFGHDEEGNIPVVSKSIISDTDLNTVNGRNNKVQFDYTDRLYDRNLVTLTLLNRVIQKDLDGSNYKNLFDIQIKQSYDIYQALYGKNKNEPLSDLSSISNLYVGDFIFSNQTNYYPYLAATNSSTTLTYLNPLQQYFKIGYASKRSEEPRQDDLSLALGFVTNYINLLTGVILDTSENRQSDARVKKVSLITQIKPPGECWAINFYRDQKVGLEAEWRIRFDFSWDGKPTKVIPPHELNIN